MKTVMRRSKVSGKVKAAQFVSRDINGGEATREGERKKWAGKRYFTGDAVRSPESEYIITSLCNTDPPFLSPPALPSECLALSSPCQTVTRRPPKL